MRKKIHVHQYGVDVQAISMDGNEPPFVGIEPDRTRVHITIEDYGRYAGAVLPIKRLVRALRKAGVIE